MMKRLIDSVVHGFGFSAGSALFDKAVEDAAKALREPTPEETKKAEAEAHKRSLAEEKQRAKAAKEAAKEAEKAQKKQSAEIDAELAALKRKMGK
jgi:hypothetical protein